MIKKYEVLFNGVRLVDTVHATSALNALNHYQAKNKLLGNSTPVYANDELIGYADYSVDTCEIVERFGYNYDRDAVISSKYAIRIFTRGRK